MHRDSRREYDRNADRVFLSVHTIVDVGFLFDRQNFSADLSPRPSKGVDFKKLEAKSRDFSWDYELPLLMRKR